MNNEGGGYTRPDSSLRYRRYINHLLTYLLTYLLIRGRKRVHLLNNPMKGKYMRHRHSKEQLKTGKSGRNSCYELMGVTHLLISSLLEWMNVYGARRHINEQSSYSSRQQQCSLFRAPERNVRLKHHSSSAGMQPDDVISHLQRPSHGLWRCAMRLACACSAVDRPTSRYKYWASLSVQSLHCHDARSEGGR